MRKSAFYKTTLRLVHRLSLISRLSFNMVVKKHNTKQCNIGALLGSSITSSLTLRLVVYIEHYSRVSKRKLLIRAARPHIRGFYGSLRIEAFDGIVPTL
jgi:hypothetical protein